MADDASTSSIMTWKNVADFVKEHAPGNDKRRTPAQIQATRRTYEALSDEQKGDFSKGGSLVSWDGKRARYVVHYYIDGKRKQHGFAQYEDATTCASMLQQLLPNTLHNKRVAKAQDLEQLAPKRAKDVATHGNSSNLERTVLLDVLIPALTELAQVKGDDLQLHAMPDGTWADLLFRFGTSGRWCSVQLKTCTKRQSETSRYHFDHLPGYAGALIICVCADPNDRHFWALDGTSVDKICGFRTGLYITKSTATGKINPEKWLGTLPISMDELYERMRSDYARALARDESVPLAPLTLTTVFEAETKLGSSQQVERAGIHAWVRCTHGGFAPDEMNWDQASRAHLPDFMQSDPLRYRLLNDGQIFAYPDEQNSKTDVLLYRKEDGFQRIERLQFKTAKRPTDQYGFLVIMGTVAGRDDAGKQLYANAYKTGDNDIYIVVLDDEVAAGSIPNTVLVWECTEAWMKAHGLIDVPDKSGTGFHLYTGINKYDAYGRERLGSAKRGYWKTAMDDDGIDFKAYAV